MSELLDDDCFTWIIATWCDTYTRGRMACATKLLRRLTADAITSIEQRILNKHFGALSALRIPECPWPRYRPLEELDSPGDPSQDKAASFRDTFISNVLSASRRFQQTSVNQTVVVNSFLHRCGMMVRVELDMPNRIWNVVVVSRAQGADTLQRETVPGNAWQPGLSTELYVCTSHPDFVVIEVSEIPLDLRRRSYYYKCTLSGATGKPNLTVLDTFQPNLLEPRLVPPTAAPKDIRWQYLVGRYSYQITLLGRQKSPFLQAPEFQWFRNMIRHEKCLIQWNRLDVLPTTGAPGFWPTAEALSVPAFSFCRSAPIKVANNMHGCDISLLVLVFDHSEPCTCSNRRPATICMVPLDPIDARPLTQLAWWIERWKPDDIVYAWWGEKSSSTDLPCWYAVVFPLGWSPHQLLVYRNDGHLIYSTRFML